MAPLARINRWEYDDGSLAALTLDVDDPCQGGILDPHKVSIKLYDAEEVGRALPAPTPVKQTYRGGKIGFPLSVDPWGDNDR